MYNSPPRCDFWKPRDSHNIRGYARNRKQISLIDDVVMGPYIGPQEAVFVKDIYEVLRKKQAEQVQLGKQIEALQTAAEQLRNVAHLLNSEEEEEKSAHQG